MNSFTNGIMMFLFSVQLLTGLSTLAQEEPNWILWKYGRPNVVVVTNAPTMNQVTNAVSTGVGPLIANLGIVSGRVDVVTSNLNAHKGAINPHGITADAIGALTLDTLPPVVIPDETDPVFTAWDKSTGITITENQVTDLKAYATETYVGNAIADIPLVDIPDETDPVFTAWDKTTGISITENQVTDLKAYATENYVGDAIANIPPVVIPDETDPRAMRAYNYGDPDIEITPESDFRFNAGTIIGYTGTDEDIVLPYEIGGVPVVAIGAGAFQFNAAVKTLKASKTLTTINSSAFAYSPLTTLTAPSLTTIGDSAFERSSLTTLTAPALTTIGIGAFYESSLTTLTAPALTTIDLSAFAYSPLTAIYYGGNQPTAGANIYQDTPSNLINYVTDPTATGWGDRFGDRPVVRLPLYADEVYIKGSLAATQPYVDNAIANIPAVDIPDETDPVFTAWDKSTGITITENQVTDLKVYATETYVGDAIANIPPVVVPDETDPRAMKLYHYGDPDIVITPASDFTFNAASGTITGYTGTNPDIVLPYEIGGIPVVAIGANAFNGNQVVAKLIAPKTLTTLGVNAFNFSTLNTLIIPSVSSIGGDAFNMSELTSLDAPALTTLHSYALAFSYVRTLVAPSLTTIGSGAFTECPLTTLIIPKTLISLSASAFESSSLTAIYYGGNQPTAGEDIYDGAPDNLINYVTSATATGWGDNFGGKPVVRLPLYADEVYIGGSLVATISPSSPWTTNIVASGTQTLKGTWGSQPRLQLSGSTTVDIDWTTYDTSGINRITLTIVSGEHPVTWLTDNIEFEEVPELSTTGSSTILIRKVGTEKAQGRQL